jgi:hypothetical protein
MPSAYSKISKVTDAIGYQEVDRNIMGTIRNILGMSMNGVLSHHLSLLSNQPLPL